jgi:hypothetical protein
MLSDEELKRAAQEVKQQTEFYEQAKAAEYAPSVIGMSTYDSQDDFDNCRPNTKGTDFQKYNEYVVEVMKGLRANGIPAEPVVVHYSEFLKYLDGKPITPEARSTFAAHLATEEAKNK